MSAFRTGSGQTLRLGSALGKGGEGTVYHVDGQGNIAAKIYTDGKHLDRRDKVSAMVTQGLHRRSELVAFPLDTLLHETGVFAGFTMRKVGQAKPIHELYAPGSRKQEFPKADFRFLVRTATNVARAIGSVLHAGCVIGDINHSGILVNDQAIVTLIDADSFQFREGLKVHRSLVGTGEYTPPELQGVALRDVDREPHHDAFGLAVLIFQLLFMGRHPFAGRYGGPGDMPIEKAIREGRFAYGGRRHETLMEPPPHVPTLQDVPPAVANFFERAFTRSLTQHTRPTPTEWVSALTSFEAELTICRVSSTHHFAKNAPSCPWCRLEAALGVSLFPTPGSSPASSTSRIFDLSAAIAAIERVQHPGPAPDPVRVVPALFHLTKSDGALEAARYLILRRVIGVCMLIGSAFAFGAAIPAVPILLVILGCGLLPEWGAFDGLQQAMRQAESNWKQVCNDWSREAGGAAFDQRKASLLNLVSEYRGLDAKEKSQLDDLERRRRDVQLQRFLEAHKIARANIEGIGEGRKTTLASYGIEDAFDVVAHRIRNVPGFGEAMTDRMLRWRYSVESRFVFYPNLGVDPTAVRQVKDSIARRRGEIQQELLRGPLGLEQIRTQIMATRSKPSQRLLDAHRAFKQAEIDLN